MLELFLNVGKKLAPYVPGGGEAFMLDPSDQVAGATTLINRGSVSTSITNSGIIVADLGPKANVKSLYFNNTALNYARIAGTNMPNLMTGDFTIEYWERAESRPGNCTIFAQWAQIAGQASFITTSSSTGSDGLAFAPYSTDANMPMSSAAFAINTWRHVAFTRNASLFSIWVNGTRVASFANSSTAAKINVDWMFGCYLGRGGNPPQDGAVRFNGWIAKLRVYTKCKYTTAFTPD